MFLMYCLNSCLLAPVWIAKRWDASDNSGGLSIAFTFIKRRPHSLLTLAPLGFSLTCMNFSAVLPMKVLRE